MAESEEVGWWGWIQSAKDQVVAQSAEVFDLVKKDINEVTKVVSEEASSMVSSTATALKKNLSLDDEMSTASSMKKSMSGFLNHVSEVFTPPPDDEDEEAFLIQNQQPVFINRLQAALYAIQQDPATFLVDPEGQEKQYEKWLETFDLEAHQEQLSQLLADCDKLRDNYTKLVPSEVAHMVFWHRYFYKADILEKADAKRQEIKKRAQETNVEKVIGWDEDEEFGGQVEIPEKMQQKLLADYEEECKSTEMLKKSNAITKAPESTKGSISSDTKKEVKAAEKVNLNDGQSGVVSGVEVLSSASSSEGESTEDWEKLNATDLESTPRESPSKESGKSDDWENWE